MNLLLVIFAYLVGSIPFGLFYGKIAGIDVRSSGSGNIGATNVNRLLGKKLGILTLISDALKGLAPMLLAAYLLADSPQKNLIVGICGLAAFMGHIFPIYLRFKGGKGVATALGVFAYLNPAALLVCAAIFIAVVYIWGYVSLGSLASAAAMPILVWGTSQPTENTIVAGLIAILIWIKHHENIGRLIRHEEKSWKNKGKGA